MEHEQKLIDHYDGILRQNTPKILAGGTADPYLSDAVNDKRMALVLAFRPSLPIAEKIAAHMDKLRCIEPNLYYYPRQDYHVTVMDILKGREGGTVPLTIDRYIQCLQECTQKIRPFYVDFDGMTASDSAILTKGFYEAGLQMLRNEIRRTLPENGLTLEERYQTVSCHITAARISQRLQAPRVFLDYIRQPVFFGTMQVDHLELVFHNWYDTQKTVLARFALGTIHGD